MRLQFVLVGLFFALMLFHIGVNGYFTLSFVSTASQPGWQLGLDGRLMVPHGWTELDVSALRNGDEVVALNGQEFRSSRQYFETFRRMPPGGVYTITVRREGQTQEFILRTAPFPLLMRIVASVATVILPAAFLLTGLIVFLLRQDDKRALLFALMLGTFWAAHAPASTVVVDLPRWLIGGLMTTHLIGACFPALALHFFLVFPERSPLLGRFPRLEYYLYLLFLLTAYPFAAINASRVISRPGWLNESQQEYFTYLGVAALYLLAGLLSLVLSYRRANQPSRRKLRVVLVGSLAGFLPPVLTNAAYLIFKLSVDLLALVIISAAYLAVLLVPLSFAYAILRHQVIPVSIIIRRGVQYLLAKNVLRLLVALPVIGLTLTVLLNPNRTLSDILFRNSLYFYVTLMVAAAMGFLFRKRLNDWIDRKFFREQYNQEKILRGLIEEVKKHDSIPEMSRLVSQKVESALHPERIYLFYREEDRGDLSLGYSSGGTSEELRIPEEFRLLRLMEGQAGAQEFPLPQKNNLPDGEQEWLAGLGTRLIVPLVGTDNRLAGLFLLGEKKSEVPYTARDRDLLEALAGQIALVYENAHLKERVHRERKIKHEVLERFEERRINLLKECPRCGACFDSSVLSCAQDGSELTFSMPVERTVEGRYQLERLVGRGGMGAVYEATDLRLSRQVAVKILSGQMFGNREALRRFEREAQSAARLSHPNIITVYDYGVLSTGGAYLVMELISGETLAALIKREGPLPPRKAAESFDQVLEGVKAAHSAGVIHRDLKPENVLISPGEQGQIRVCVLDFGLAKIRSGGPEGADSPTSLVTKPGTVLGTFGYMSPEQLTGAAVDERSDLFSVGVMVVEALTGRRPFRGRTYPELLTSILHGSFHLESNSREAERLDEALQKCLAKDREHRFSSAGEMQRELIPAIREYRSLTGHEWTSSEADTLPY